MKRGMRSCPTAPVYTKKFTRTCGLFCNYQCYFIKNQNKEQVTSMRSFWVVLTDVKKYDI